ncbi:small ribosomal subunit protein uS15m [Neosynchiropus ocellatus]
MLALRTFLKSPAGILKESGALCSAVKAWASPALASGHAAGCVAGVSAVHPPVRHYARGVKKKEAAPQSHLSDLDPTMLKMDYQAVPIAQTTDDIVKRLLTLELASHSEKLKLKEEQLIAKVQRDKNDRSSAEVRVAVLTSRIRNLQEHLQAHHKDKANKRRMLLAIDKRKKLLKNMRLVRYDAFERVCEQLGIIYTFPPEYYKRATHRWVAKKAFCLKLYQEIQKQKAAQKMQMKQRVSAASTKGDDNKAADSQ